MLFFSGGRTIGAIIGIISACSLFVLLIACCIVYYRRYLERKGQYVYTTRSSSIEEKRNHIIENQHLRDLEICIDGE